MVGEGILYIFSINLSIAIKECGVSIFKMVVYFSKGLFFLFLSLLSFSCVAHAVNIIQNSRPRYTVVTIFNTHDKIQ